MSQEQLEKYFKDTIELIIDKSKDYYQENDIELTEEKYKKQIGNILKSFINKFHSYQSQLLFSNINRVEIDYEKEDIKLNKEDFNTDNFEIENTEETINDILSSQTDFTPSSPKSESPTPFNINYWIQKHNLNNITIQDTSDKESSNDGYSSDPEFETQCCARISNEWFKIDDYSSEFLDKYPAGVFITTDGYVVGKPCHNMIPDEEFDEGKIFCNRHCSSNYEDIREAPSILDTDT